MSKHIVIMAGGTGGHVFPALAVAQNLQQQGWSVSWLGTRKGLESRVVPENGIAIDWLTVEGLRGKGLLAKVTALAKLVSACLQARRILKQRQPKVVLGMGGFVAGPGGLMAKALGIPLVIHEQNRVPGTTNRWLAKLAATVVLEAFPNSFQASVNARCTGNPVRQALLQLTNKAAWHHAAGRPLNLLVVGGSQGAKVLNEIVPAALADISNISITHQTGSAMQADVAAAYQALGLQATVSAFIDDMAATYQAADLVICRAGAMTVSELAACGLPAILVPLASAIDDHQTANARYLADAGAAILLPQAALSPESLASAIQQALPQLSAMQAAAHHQARLDATDAVADCCIAEAKS